LVSAKLEAGFNSRRHIPGTHTPYMKRREAPINTEYPEFQCDTCERWHTKIYSEGEGFYCWMDLTPKRRREFLSMAVQHENTKAREREVERIKREIRFSPDDLKKL
jgi:hypothetical protein